MIDNINLLNLNSVNALLKVIEEPNDNINFILINSNKRVLPTLKSRCINFKISLSQNQVIEIANKIFKNCQSVPRESPPANFVNETGSHRQTAHSTGKFHRRSYRFTGESTPTPGETYNPPGNRQAN